MSKKTMVYFESDFVDGVTFDNKEDKRDFDNLINNEDYYLRCCKKYIECYYKYLYDNINSVIDLSLDNGKIIFNISKTFSQYLIDNVITTENIYNTSFSLSYYISEECFNDEEALYSITDYVVDKIKEFTDDINKLVQFVLS